MAKKVLSIEIGQQVTKAVVIDYLKKNPHVYNAFAFDNPSDIIEDGYIKDRDRMAVLLRDQMRDNGVKEKDVVFSIASSKIASREVVVPFVPEKQLDTLINNTSQDYFPVNMDEYTVAYNVLETVKEGDKKSLKLLLLAAPDTLIENYYSLADLMGVHVVSIDYFGNGSMQVLQKHIGSGYSVCVQIGSLNTMVSVLKENQQIMQRTIPYGTGAIIETMLQHPALECRDETDAMEMLCRENVVYSTLDYEDETVRGTRISEDQWKRSSQSKEARKAVTDAVGGILLSVIRVVDYFNSRYPDYQLGYIYITGMGVKIRGLDMLFEREMDLPVRKLETLNNITFSRGFNRSLQDQTEFIGAIGAAIDPVGFYLKELKYSKSSSTNTRTSKIIFAASIVAALGMVGFGWFQLNAANQANDDLQMQKANLQYINDIIEENDRATKEYNDMANLHKTTATTNQKLVEIIGLLEKALPKQMQVETLRSTETGIVMSVRTKTKISAAKMLAMFEEIEVVTDVKALQNIQVASIAGVAEGNEIGEYAFSVSADYAPWETQQDKDVVIDGVAEDTETTEGTDATAGTTAE
ncbi:MAG: pilus assembly protein PilM [Lachnospiraceae bacterium]|nr:pilus assembly protein PilM [Lachnospiraceae bacterium]